MDDPRGLGGLVQHLFDFHGRKLTEAARDFYVRQLVDWRENELLLAVNRWCASHSPAGAPPSVQQLKEALREAKRERWDGTKHDVPRRDRFFGDFQGVTPYQRAAAPWVRARLAGRLTHAELGQRLQALEQQYRVAPSAEAAAAGFTSEWLFCEWREQRERQRLATYWHPTPVEDVVVEVEPVARPTLPAPEGSA